MIRISGKSLAVLGVALLLFTAWGASPAHAVTTMQPASLSASSPCDYSCNLKSVWGTGSSNVYVVGYSYEINGTNNLPLVAHYDGADWSRVNLPLPAGWISGYLEGLGGSSASDVYAVGYGVDAQWHTMPLLYHFDGNGWSEASSSLPTGWGGGILFGVWGSGSGDVYLAGYGSSALSIFWPLLYHYDGSTWSEVSLSLPVGFDQGSWYGVWGAGASDVYVVGYGRYLDGPDEAPLLYHYDGSTWSEISLSLPTGWVAYIDDLYRVWGSGAKDVYVAGSAFNALQDLSSLLYHYDGNTWSTISLPPLSGQVVGKLYGVWGSSASDVYVSGDAWGVYDEMTLLYHYDGSGWAPVSVSPPAGSSPGELDAIWGSSSTDVYAVGNGAVYHYNGSGWTASGISPQFSASPDGWDFGLVKLNTSLRKTFTITNTGLTALTISGKVTKAGANPGQFPIMADHCSGATLPFKGTCTITVAFRPTWPGNKSASFTFPDSAPDGPHQIWLGGQGGVELARNGGFNVYPSSMAKIPSSWVAANFAPTDGKDIIYKKEGTASIKMAGQAGKIKTLTQTWPISGAAGNSFLLSLWRKGLNIPATAGVAQAQVLFYNGPTWKQTVWMPLPTGSYGFTLQTKTFTASYPYTRIVIKLIYSKATGAAWFDGLSLLRSP